MNSQNGQETALIKGTWKEVMEMITNWREVSQEVADKIVGRTIRRKQREKINN